MVPDRWAAGACNKERTEDRWSSTLSVAMCTYNGAAFLKEQLDSILTQKRLPDELVVCDDASSDATVRILEEFRDRAPFPMHLQRNPRRLGIAKNVEQAIGLCSGDVIAICDQDDVWMPDKLSTLEQSLLDNPEAGYVFSDGVVVDERLRPLGYTIWQAINFRGAERERFSRGDQVPVLLRRNVVTGAAMAFRSELCERILPIPEEFVPDAWIALASSIIGRNGVPIESPLIYYRRHNRQAVGIGPAPSRVTLVTRPRQELYGQWLAEAERLQGLRPRLLSLGEEAQFAADLLSAKIKHFQARAAACGPSTLRGLLAVGTEIVAGRYWRFSSGIGSAGVDFLRVLGVLGAGGSQSRSAVRRKRSPADADVEEGSDRRGAREE